MDGVNAALARKGAGFGVRSSEKFVNNSVRKAGITLLTDRQISPVFYPPESWLQNATDDEVADRLIDLDADAGTKDIDIPEILSEDFILANVHPRLYGEANRGEMDKLGRVYTNFLDMIIAYYVVIPAMSGEDGVSSIAVTKDLLESAGLTVDDIHDRSIANMDGEIQVRPVSEVMSSFIGVELPVEDMAVPELMLVSNRTTVYGASAILSQEAQCRLCEILGSEWYILPSSIHECLTLSKCMVDDVSELIEMVTSINQDHVSNEDRLTDAVYMFRNGAIEKVE